MKAQIIVLLAFATCAFSLGDEFSRVERRLEVNDEGNQTRDGRIVNGMNASPNQFPHMVRLIINGNIICSASLISDLWVLTAAHCISSIKSATAYMGSIYVDKFPVQRAVVLAVWLTNRDIAVLKLQSPVPISASVKPIALPSGSQATATYTDTLLIASGFGGMSNGQLASTLQYTHLKGISVDECRKYYGNGMDFNHLCATGYPNPRQSICGGDSGGPIFTTGSNPIVVGVSAIMLVGSEGCQSGYPQGFTRVGLFVDWIRSEMSK